MTYTDEQTEKIEQPTPAVEQAYKGDYAPIMSFGEWFGTLLIMIIPILNFIMLIVWMSESYTNPNKVNWAKATLVLIGIQLVVGMFILGTFIGTFTHMMSNLGSSGLW